MARKKKAALPANVGKTTHNLFIMLASGKPKSLDELKKAKSYPAASIRRRLDRLDAIGRKKKTWRVKVNERAGVVRLVKAA